MRCNWTPAKYMNLLYSIVFPLFYSKELSALYTIEPLSPAHRSRNPIYIAVAVWWYITFTKREQLLCFDEHMIFSDNVFIAFFHSQFCYIYNKYINSIRNDSRRRKFSLQIQSIEWHNKMTALEKRVHKTQAIRGRQASKSKTVVNSSFLVFIWLLLLLKHCLTCNI